jgi:creatinine amidohydrolase/Fe(II)-dependent formamide hydrolase-like protein
MDAAQLLTMLVVMCLMAAVLKAWEHDAAAFPPDPAVLPAHLEQMRPGQIRDAAKQGAACIVPVGTLESDGGDDALGGDAAALEAGVSELARKQKVVVAPPVRYAPTGYILSGPGDGTFHVEGDAFANYLAEVLVALRKLGFAKVRVACVHNPQGADGPLARAVQHTLADLFINLWKDPSLGPNWWDRPDREQISWEHYDLIELPHPKAAATAPATVPAATSAPALALRWEHMTPPQMRDAVRRGLPCLVPLGVLENHGNHNPVGCDAFEAQDPVVLAASEAAAVVAPTVWYGPTGYGVTGPELGTTDVDPRIFRAYARGIVGGLAAVGFRNVIFVQVHQGLNGAEGGAFQMGIADYRASLYKEDRFGPGWGRDEALKLLPPKMEVIAPPHALYDHAGMNETSWMLHLRPGCVDMSLLRKGDYNFCWYPGDESVKATADHGRQMTDKAVEGLAEMIRQRTAGPQ